MVTGKQNSREAGLKFRRRFTKDEVNVFDQFEYDYRTSVIRNPTGEVVFEMNNVEVPKQWSQIATDILAQKYFRKAGVPARLVPIEEPGVPGWLWRRRADTRTLGAMPESARYGGESSARQVFDRMAGAGWQGGDGMH